MKIHASHQNKLPTSQPAWHLTSTGSLVSRNKSPINTLFTMIRTQGSSTWANIDFLRFFFSFSRKQLVFSETDGKSSTPLTLFESSFLEHNAVVFGLFFWNSSLESPSSIRSNYKNINKFIVFTGQTWAHFHRIEAVLHDAMFLQRNCTFE